MVHTIFLLLRTYLSLLVAKLDGIIVRDLVSADAKGFLRGLGYWYLLALPSTYTNAMIRYLQSKLALSFRTRLTRYVHDLYLSKAANFYKVINLDNRIEGADQFITTDVARFCDSLAGLYSNISKPTLDLILFNIQLGRSIGRWGSLGLMVNYILTAWILRKVMPGFGKLAAIEAKLEGDFRSAHSRLITNAEEIAFYGGAELEKSILTRAYLRLIRHVNSIFKIRIAYAMVEDWLLKYSWSAIGYVLVSGPVFMKKAAAKVEEAAGVDLQKVVEKVQPAVPGGDSIAKRTEGASQVFSSQASERVSDSWHERRLYFEPTAHVGARRRRRSSHDQQQGPFRAGRLHLAGVLAPVDPARARRRPLPIRAPARLAPGRPTVLRPRPHQRQVG